jgi:hypothetical protein
MPTHEDGRWRPYPIHLGPRQRAEQKKCLRHGRADRGRGFWLPSVRLGWLLAFEPRDRGKLAEGKRRQSRRRRFCGRLARWGRRCRQDVIGCRTMVQDEGKVENMVISQISIFLPFLDFTMSL